MLPCTANRPITARRLITPVSLALLLLMLQQPQVTRASYKSQFQAQCILNRQPFLTSNPVVRLYSASTHRLEGGSDCEPAEGAEFRLWDADERDQQRQAISDQLLPAKDDDDNNTLYDPRLPTYVLIHGFLVDWKTSDWMCKLKNQILDQQPANVLILDWSGGSKPLLPIDYSQSVSNTEQVADLLAIFLETLFELTPPNNASSLHLVGHSLGAHIAGFVGYSLQGSAAQIVGLDPAGPCFGSRPAAPTNQSPLIKSGFLEPGKSTRRLSRASARLVTAIHTDTSMLGLAENCATTDVYVNGGERQPGSSDMLDVTYSHSFAHEILAAYTSSTPPHLCFPVAYLCPSWAAYETGQCGVCPAPPDNGAASGQCTIMGLSLSGGASSSVAKQAAVMRPTDKLYIKLPGEPNSCFFTYQVVLAFKRELPAESAFYLELNTTKLAASRSRGQFFRVANPVAVGSDAHKRLASEQAHLHRALNRSLPAAATRQFYTALLTFPATEGCRLADASFQSQPPVVGDGELCGPPLDGLTEARVWSDESLGQLAPLNSLSLNYMSGPNHSERLKHSYLIPSNQGPHGQVLGEAASASSTTSTSKKPLNVVRAFRNIAEQPIKCLTELQCSAQDSAADLERFKYFLRLRLAPGLLT